MAYPSFPLVVASAPRCLELLKQIGLVPAVVRTQNMEALPRADDMPALFSLRRANLRALEAFRHHPNLIIFSADTIVGCGRRILSPVKTIDEAYQSLKLLSGRRHQVYTSLCLILPETGVTRHRTVKTTVTFKRLHASEIELYLESREWEDTCGYTFHGLSGRFIKRLNGSPSNLLGLPLFEAYNLLKTPLGLPG